MATDNRKVSGYLPQCIFDVFEDFREKRSLSTSSALITILSEYFQVDQKVDYQSSLLSDNEFVSKDRFEALENKLSELNSSLLSELDKLVEQRFSSLHSELLNSLPKHIESEAISVESSLVSEPLDELPSELLKNEPLIEAGSIPVKSEPPSESSDKSPHLQLKFIDSILEKEDSKVEDLIPKSISEQLNSTLSESSKSIQTKLLANRLNVKPELISKRKKEKSEEELYDWLQGKDPDKISWQPTGGSLKGYSKGWIPAEDTPSELLSKLSEWLAANPE